MKRLQRRSPDRHSAGQRETGPGVGVPSLIPPTTKVESSETRKEKKEKKKKVQSKEKRCSRRPREQTFKSRGRESWCNHSLVGLFPDRCMKPPLLSTPQAAAFPPCTPEILLPNATRVERRKRELAASTERVRELRSRRGVETSGRVTVKNFTDGLGQWAHLAGGRRSAFHRGTGAKRRGVAKRSRRRCRRATHSMLI